MRMTTRYRELIKRPEIAVMVGAYDALSAKLVERAGFDLTFVHDSGVSASLLGMPDMGVVTLTEMTDILEKVVKAVNIPVIGDGGCGFGNPVNTWRTVREYESIGVAGVNLEDQVYPKRCGHLAGKQVVEPAGAAALAALLFRRVPVATGDRVVVILSGGNVDLARIPEFLERAAPVPGA